MNILHAITLAALLHHAPAPIPVCHAGAVSYRFVGTVGATFSYEGASYTVPASGWIELVANGGGRVYLAANGRTLPLDVWPIDAFGTRTVPLQVASSAPAQSEGGTISTINN
ncbi:MAG TPA: hypothetical protein VNN08_19065 [Thermoanaerobaculia bacterium]|nr:hypothetical protein [Thermoanaerobaculia bacterium]